MADAWLPTAGRMLAKADGGTMKGGAPRAVWLTNEADPRAVSARSVALALNREDRPAHLIWNPCLGDIVQMLPITLAGRQLTGEVGREGRACVQIMVIGSAQRPFTDGPLIGLESILNWLDIWSVPRHWPAGPPLPTPQSYHASRGRRAWARGGHFGCSQVPETTSPGPGGIDIRRITGPETPLVDIPRPRAIPVVETVLPPRLIRRPFEAVQGHGEESLVSSGLRATRVRPTA